MAFSLLIGKIKRKVLQIGCLTDIAVREFFGFISFLYRALNVQCLENLKEDEMKTVVLEIEDSKFEQFMTMINLLKSDVVKKFEVRKKEDDEAIDEQHCLEVLDRINRGDYSGIKKVSSDELFRELGI